MRKKTFFCCVFKVDCCRGGALVLIHELFSEAEGFSKKPTVKQLRCRFFTVNETSYLMQIKIVESCICIILMHSETFLAFTFNNSSKASKHNGVTSCKLKTDDI